MTTLDTIKRASVVGIAGTFAMTMYSFVATHLHLPRYDMHDFIGGLFHLDHATTWLVYLVAGVVFAHLYQTYFKTRMPARAWMRGVVYSLGMWVVMQFVVMPIVGMGFFTGSISAALGALFGLASYGAMVGFLYEQ